MPVGEAKPELEDLYIVVQENGPACICTHVDFQKLGCLCRKAYHLGLNLGRTSNCVVPRSPFSAQEAQPAVHVGSIIRLLIKLSAHRSL